MAPVEGYCGRACEGWGVFLKGPKTGLVGRVGRAIVPVLGEER